MKQTNELFMIRNGFVLLLQTFSPKIILLHACMLMCICSVFSQNTVTISGEVISYSDSKGLPSVTIREKDNLASGTVTSLDGKFEMNVSSGTVLVFSYVGFLNEEVLIESQDYIQVTMREDILNLDEFTVVGYGFVKKSDLTGSVSSIKPTDFENQPINNVSASLQGRAPGVVVSRASGAPGSQTKIRSALRSIGYIF